MGRKKWALIAVVTLVVTAVLLALFFPRVPKEKMANTVVMLVPSSDKVAPGEHFTVDVVIEPATGANVAGAQFDLDFNPQSLQIDSVAEGNFLNQGGAQTYFNPGIIDNTAGKLKSVWGAVIGPGQTLPNFGTLATLSCTAKNAATTSAFALSNVIVGSKDGVAVPLEPITVGQVAVILFGDVNNDGTVNLTDLLALAAVFGQTGAPGFSPADLDLSGAVDVLDAILVAQHFSAA